MLRADITEDRETTMAHFLNGLRPEIAEQVELQHHVELSDLVEKAIMIERKLKRRGQPRNYTNFSPSYTRNSLPKKEEKGAASSTPSRLKQDSTKWESKPTPRTTIESSKGRSRDTKCFKCQGRGHIASQCLNQHTKITEQVELQHYVKLSDLVEKAIKIERRLKRRGQLRNCTNLSPAHT